uniref:Ig-like domain-containing protein n=1 Tax=Macrostomum lignano TaxID=282301 RepID=A0A1I8IX56_9PLAT
PRGLRRLHAPSRLGEELAEVKRPATKVIWQKNKKTLTFDKAHLDPRFQIVPTDIHTRNKFDVKIKDLRVSDEGMYRCIASYQSNYLIKNVTLLIKVPPTIDAKKSSPLNLVLVEGTSQALTCMADGVPRPRIVWYRLVDDNKIELSNDSIYLIRNVTRDMAGTVACVANNTVEPVDTREFSLIVHYAPTVSLMNEQISQRRGKATMVMCSIRGKPDPQFYWEYRGRRFHYSRHSQCNPPEPLQKHCMHLTMNEGTETRQLSLLINNLTDSDYGQYYCVGHSALGSDRKVVRVTELEPPKRWQPVHSPRPGPDESRSFRPNIYSAQTDDEPAGGRLS